jgi:hypothetical protein
MWLLLVRHNCFEYDNSALQIQLPIQVHQVSGIPLLSSQNKGEIEDPRSVLVPLKLLSTSKNKVPAKSPEDMFPLLPGQMVG